MQLRKCVIVAFLLYLFVFPIFVSLPFVKGLDWMDTDWAYRKGFTITNASESGTGYQLMLIVYYGSGSDSDNEVYLDGSCRTDFGDVRITDNDKTTKLNYYEEVVVSSDYAKIWFKVTDDLTSDTMGYIYYGNPSATSESYGTGTFDFFDDFNDESINATLWNEAGGSPSESSGYLSVSNGEVLSQDTVTISHRQVGSFWVNTYLAHGQFCFSKVTADAEYMGFWSNGANSFITVAKDDAINNDGVTYKPTSTFWRLEYDWDVDSGTGQTIDYYNKDTIEFIRTYSDLSVGEQAPYIRFLSTTASLEIRCDWIFIAKFTDPEPYISAWGSEECINLDVVNRSINSSDDYIFPDDLFELNVYVSEVGYPSWKMIENVTLYLMPDSEDFTIRAFNNSGVWSYSVISDINNHGGIDDSLCSYSEVNSTTVLVVFSIMLYENFTWGSIDVNVTSVSVESISSDSDLYYDVFIFNKGTYLNPLYVVSAIVIIGFIIFVLGRRFWS